MIFFLTSLSIYSGWEKNSKKQKRRKKKKEKIYSKRSFKFESRIIAFQNKEKVRFEKFNQRMLQFKNMLCMLYVNK